LTIDIVSPAPIPTHLVTMVGNLITQVHPVAERNPHDEQHVLAGSYQVIAHSDYRTVAKAYQQVRMHLPEVALPDISDRLPYLFDVSQAAVACRLPASSLIPLPGIEMRSHRQLRPPRDLSTTGTIIGEYSENGITSPIYISTADRTRHCYIIGQTGTGKSTVLKSMILDDINNGRGVCAVDPHGDLVNDILAQIPAHRHDDVIVIDPTQTDFPIGINVLEYQTPEERETTLMLFFSMMKRLASDKGGDAERWSGPGWERYTRNNSYWVTQDVNDPGTVVEFHQMMENPEYYKRWEPIDESDAKLVNWRAQLANQNIHHSKDSHSLSTSVNTQFDDFIFDTRLRLIFGQKRSTIDFFEAMNSQKIILVNLSRGLLSEAASAFVGYIVLAKLQQAALKRAELPAAQRSLFSIYVDEFQNYTTDSFVSLLSESRKYGIALTLANQFLAQIENKRIINAVLGNVGTVIAFRVGIADGEFLKPRFAPEVTPDDLINLPNWQAYVSTQVNGQSRRPFSLHTIRPLDNLDIEAIAALIQQSKMRYGTPRAKVEVVIHQSMQLTRSTTTVQRSGHTHIHIDAHIYEQYTPLAKANSKAMTLQHGHGLSLWCNTNAEGMLHGVGIGMPPHVTTQLLATPLAEIIPYQHRLGSGYAAFHEMMTTHNITTLHDAVAWYRTNTALGTTPAHVRNYLGALLAYHTRHGTPPTPWIDIAICATAAVALDANGRAVVWNNQFQAVYYEQHNVRAIACTSRSAYVVNMQGRVRKYTPNHVQYLSDLPAIQYIAGSDSMVVMIDTMNHIHVHGDSPSFDHTLASDSAEYLLAALGQQHVVACTTNHEVVAWGSNNEGQSDVPPELTTGKIKIAALAAGSDFSCALDTQGRLYVWGNKQRRMRSHTLDRLNQKGVTQVTSTLNSITCQTRDGMWWFGDNPFAFPPHIQSTRVCKVVFNTQGVWMALMQNEPAASDARFFGLKTLQLRTIATIPAELVAQLQRHHISTVYDVVCHSAAALSQKIATFIVDESPINLTPLIDVIAEMLTTHGITHNWPTTAVNISDIVPDAPHMLWYLADFDSTPPARDDDDDFELWFSSSDD